MHVVTCLQGTHALRLQEGCEKEQKHIALVAAQLHLSVVAAHLAVSHLVKLFMIR